MQPQLAQMLVHQILYLTWFIHKPIQRARNLQKSLLEALLPLLLPNLTDAIGEIEIPSISGFGFNNVNSVIDQGHLQMTGALQIQ